MISEVRGKEMSAFQAKREGKNLFQDRRKTLSKIRGRTIELRAKRKDEDLTFKETRKSMP